jgi:hypothetical protein
LTSTFKRTWKEKGGEGLLPMKFGIEDGEPGKKEFATFEECYETVISHAKNHPPNEWYTAAVNNYKK